MRRYGRGNGYIIWILIAGLIVGFFLFGGDLRNQAISYVSLQIAQIKDSYLRGDANNNNVSRESAEKIFYDNKEVFLQAVGEGVNTTNLSLNTSFSDHQYVSITKRYDFGGNKIIAFVFQNTGNMGTEIIYSPTELQTSSALKIMEKNWYTNVFIN